MNLNIFNNKLKPTFNEYNLDDLKNLYKLKTNEEIDNIEKNDLIDKLNILWKNTPLDNDIDCAFCMELVTNGDNMITNCGHYYHTTCYLKYINSSMNNFLGTTIQETSNLSNIFKCPKCRNNLIEINQYNINNNQYNINNNQNNINNDFSINDIPNLNDDTNEVPILDPRYDYFNNDINMDINTGLWVFNNASHIILNNEIHNEIYNNYQNLYDRSLPENSSDTTIDSINEIQDDTSIDSDIDN